MIIRGGNNLDPLSLQQLPDLITATSGTRGMKGRAHFTQLQ